jgi:hypothetical protein
MAWRYTKIVNSAFVVDGIVDTAGTRDAPKMANDLKHSYDRYFGAAKALAFGQVYSTSPEWSETS